MQMYSSEGKTPISYFQVTETLISCTWIYILYIQHTEVFSSKDFYVNEIELKSLNHHHHHAKVWGLSSMVALQSKILNSAFPVFHICKLHTNSSNRTSRAEPACHLHWRFFREPSSPRKSASWHLPFDFGIIFIFHVTFFLNFHQH